MSSSRQRGNCIPVLKNSMVSLKNKNGHKTAVDNDLGKSLDQHSSDAKLRITFTNEKTDMFFET